MASAFACSMAILASDSRRTASALALSSSEGPEGGGGGAALRRGAWRVRAIGGGITGASIVGEKLRIR